MEVKNTFPWKKSYISSDEIIARFERLKKYKPRFTTKQFKVRNLDEFDRLDLSYYGDEEVNQKLLEYALDDYQLYNEISDYFIEEVRSQAKRNDEELNMLDYWIENEEQIVDTAKSEYDDYDKNPNYYLRETLFSMYHEVGTFRPTNLVSIIDLFEPKSILDPYSGWGDRMIASMARGVDYTGVDPNTDLHSGYEEMIN